MADHVISFKEAADVCGFSIATLRRLVDRGDGPKMTQLSPRRLGFRESHLTEWLDARLPPHRIVAIHRPRIGR